MAINKDIQNLCQPYSNTKTKKYISKTKKLLVFNKKPN